MFGIPCAIAVIFIIYHALEEDKDGIFPAMKKGYDIIFLDCNN